MKKRILYRQGDVLLELVDTDIPAGATEVPREGGDVILQHGEVTGHAHRITSRHATLYRTETDQRYMRVMGPAPIKQTIVIPADPNHIEWLYDEGGYPAGERTVAMPERIEEIIIAAPGGVALAHEEHGAIALPPGNYRVTIHAEYHPGELPRQVAD